MNKRVSVESIWRAVVSVLIGSSLGIVLSYAVYRLNEILFPQYATPDRFTALSVFFALPFILILYGKLKEVR